MSTKQLEDLINRNAANYTPEWLTHIVEMNLNEWEPEVITTDESDAESESLLTLLAQYGI